MLYSAGVLSEKECGREALNLRGYCLSVRHIARYKAYRKVHVVSVPGTTLPFATGRRFHLSQTVQNDGLSNSS